MLQLCYKLFALICIIQAVITCNFEMKKLDLAICRARIWQWIADHECDSADVTLTVELVDFGLRSESGVVSFLKELKSKMKLNGSASHQRVNKIINGAIVVSSSVCRDCAAWTQTGSPDYDGWGDQGLVGEQLIASAKNFPGGMTRFLAELRDERNEKTKQRLSHVDISDI